MIQAIQKLEREKYDLAMRAEKILTEAMARENPGMTDEEEATFDKMHEDIEALSKRLRQMNQQHTVNAALEESRGVVAGKADVGSTADDAPNVPDALDTYLRKGSGALTAEQRSSLEFEPDGVTCQLPNIQRNLIHRVPEARELVQSSDGLGVMRLLAMLEAEKRAQSVGTDSEGGYTVPEGFFGQLTESMLAWGGMRQARSFILRTATGNTLPMPTVNDTGNSGALLAENTQDSEQDVTFAEISLGAYKYTSKIIRVSKELLQDSAFDIAGYLAKAFGTRIGRITNLHYTTGDGSGKPNGAVTASSVGVTGADGTPDYDHTYLEMLDLKHSVDPAYRVASEWMFNDTVLLKTKKLADSQNRPLWNPSLTSNEPDRIDGDRYIVNQDMASPATTAKIMLYGDFSQYVIRDVLDISIARLEERYADFHQVGFVAIMRTDADLLDAGTDPLKHFANPA